MPAVPAPDRLPFTAEPDGIAIAVRLTPRARRSGVEGVAADADGGTVLKVAVSAVPEDGKANAALIALLARAWRVPKTSLTLRRGAADRRKTLHLAGPPADLRARLTGWLASLDATT